MQIMKELGKLLEQKETEVEAWLAARYAEHPAFFYGSVDLRHSGTKIAPVDTNLFPGGFNNLAPEAKVRAAQQAARYMQRHHPLAKKILVLAESHTRNLAYLENVACLLDILREAGFEVLAGTLNPEAVTSGALTLTTKAERELVEHALVRAEAGSLVTAGGWTPDVVLVNNDFSSGAPEILKDLPQPVMPPVGMGWYRRRKRVHFAAYDALAREFGEAFGLDHWLISAYFRNCGMVDFRSRTGFECVATNAEMVLDILRVKYAEYGIKEDPYVFVKADSGTYGMGIMIARSGEEILAMNKKSRHKMDVIKEGATNTEVLIQEGVPTVDRVDGLVAEPMIYVVDDAAVGGAFRVNTEKDERGNLNSPGMGFRPICPDGGMPSGVSCCPFPIYALMARLATLSAAREHY